MHDALEMASYGAIAERIHSRHAWHTPKSEDCQEFGVSLEAGPGRRSGSGEPLLRLVIKATEHWRDPDDAQHLAPPRSPATPRSGASQQLVECDGAYRLPSARLNAVPSSCAGDNPSALAIHRSAWEGSTPRPTSPTLPDPVIRRRRRSPGEACQYSVEPASADARGSDRG